MDYNKEQEDDAIIFFNKYLKKTAFPIHLQSRVMRSLWLRLLGLKMWTEGKVSFSEAVQNFLPERMKSPKLSEKLFGYITEKLDDVFSSLGLYVRGYVNLFGKRFVSASERSLVDTWNNFFILLNQIVVHDQYYVRKLLREDSIIIDAGANSGIFCVFAATASPQGEIYAFEPGAEAFKALKENTNYYPNIKINKCALGDKSANGILMMVGSTTGNSIIDADANIPSGVKTENVSIESIDHFVQTAGLERVDYIKIDTEGYEEKVLLGARETIKNFSPTIVMSAYHKAEDMEKLPKTLNSISPSYICRLDSRMEAVFVCTAE